MENKNNDAELNNNDLNIPPSFSEMPEKKQKNLKLKLILGGIIFLLMIITFVGGMSWHTQMKKQQLVEEWEAPGIPVKTLMVSFESIDEVVDTTGVISPDQEVIVYPEVSGKIQKIFVDLGDEVEAGSPLVAIDDEMVRLQVKQLSAQVSKLEAMYQDSVKNLRRLEKLYNQRGVSEMDLDQARLAEETNSGFLKEAKATLEMAQLNLKDTTVKSPIAGLVAVRFVEVGTLVSPQVPLLRLVNINKVKIEVGLIDEEISRVRIGQEAVIEVDVFPDNTYTGKVTAIGSQAGDNLTFPVQIELDNQDFEEKLLPGMIARVSIKIKHHSQVVVIPQEVIRRDNNKPIVFIIKDGLAQIAELKLGPKIKDRVIVKSGLSKGEQLVTVGHELLHSGIKVAIDKEG